MLRSRDVEIASHLSASAALLSVASMPDSVSAQTDSVSPAPGRLIDLGGYKLHLNCTGSGTPTVVLSAGVGDFSTDWALVQPKVATFTRVCSYDRSGAAWSNGKLTRMRLLAQNRPIPAPRSKVTADDAMTPDEVKGAQGFIKDVIGKPTIDPPFDKLPPDAQRVRLWGSVQPKLFAQSDDYLAEVSARVYAETQSTMRSRRSLRRSLRRGER